MSKVGRESRIHFVSRNCTGATILVGTGAQGVSIWLLLLNGTSCIYQDVAMRIQLVVHDIYLSLIGKKGENPENGFRVWCFISEFHLKTLTQQVDSMVRVPAISLAQHWCPLSTKRSVNFFSCPRIWGRLEDVFTLRTCSRILLSTLKPVRLPSDDTGSVKFQLANYSDFPQFSPGKPMYQKQLWIYPYIKASNVRKRNCLE